MRRSDLVPVAEKAASTTAQAQPAIRATFIETVRIETVRIETAMEDAR